MVVVLIADVQSELLRVEFDRVQVHAYVRVRLDESWSMVPDASRERDWSTGHDTTEDPLILAMTRPWDTLIAVFAGKEVRPPEVAVTLRI